MKNIEEMSEKEILSLTDEQIEKIVKLRKAEEGIKLIEIPELPEYEEEIEKDLILYKSSWISNIYFENVQDVDDINKFLISKKVNALYGDWSGNLPVNFKSLDSYDKNIFDIRVISESFFSEKVREQAEQISKRNKEKRDVYEKLSKEYDDYIEGIQWIIDEVWDKVFEVRRKYERLAKLQRDFSEYKVLADGDEKIAEKFLLKANPITNEELEIVKGEKICNIIEVMI